VRSAFQPTRARLACVVGREVGDRRQVHAGRARNLRQVHGAELAGADQADADRLAFGGALLEFAYRDIVFSWVPAYAGMTACAVTSSFVRTVRTKSASALAGMPFFHGRSTG
jgi:hypothetical protein